MAVLAVLLFARTTAAGPAQLEVVGDACSLGELDAEVTALAANSGATPPTRVRVVSAASCSELVESIALVIAMALEEARADEDARAEVAIERLGWSRRPSRPRTAR